MHTASGCISGKYNLWLSPGVWPTGGFFVGENTPLGLKTTFFEQM